MAELDGIAAEYRQWGDVPRLLERLSALAARASSADLIAAAEPFLELHEVAGPLYEVIAAREPDNARALVILGNAYWLTGRGPDVVADLAARAIAADPSHRGAWHLWALAEPASRQRVQRWQQVVARFPDDDLAKASLADNAAALAGAEDDPVALKLAVSTYETLLQSATHPATRSALANALHALRNRES